MKVKLNDLMESILIEGVSRDRLIKAMEDRTRVSIFYDSPYGTEDKGWRRIEPYSYGINKAGNMVLRAYQINGASDTPEGKPNDPLTKIPGWRMFRLDGIKNVNFGGGDTFDEPREGYNPNDKDMKVIYRSVSFDDISNDTDALSNDFLDNKEKEPNVNFDKVSQDPNNSIKEPISDEGENDKRLADKPDWVQKMIKRFKDFVKK